MQARRAAGAVDPDQGLIAEHAQARTADGTIDAQPVCSPHPDRPPDTLPERALTDRWAASASARTPDVAGRSAGGGEHVEAAAQLADNVRALQDGRPPRGEYQRQGEAAQLVAHFDQMRTLLRGQAVAHLDSACLLKEQRAGFGALEVNGVARQTETVDVQHPLTFEVQGRPRGDQDLHVRRLLQQLTHFGRTGLQVFEVVQHQEERACLEVGGEAGTQL